MGNVASRRASASGVLAAIELDSAAFRRDLVAHLKQMEVHSEQALVRVGYQVLSKARYLCPVDTGRLRASIILTQGRDGQGFYVEIGTNVHYARFVEFGTRYNRAQPFLLPAVALASGYWRSEAA
jgi:HK97 gp10 family phage protein